MQIKIDPRAGAPIYIQIVDQVRHQIASGELKPDDQLPTVRQLAADLRVNWNTVARAYRLLDEAGLISTQQGRGTYVWEKPSEESDRTLRQEALQALARQFLFEANKLGFNPAEATRALSGEAGGAPRAVSGEAGGAPRAVSEEADRPPAGQEDPASM